MSRAPMTAYRADALVAYLMFGKRPRSEFGEMIEYATYLFDRYPWLEVFYHDSKGSE